MILEQIALEEPFEIPAPPHLVSGAPSTTAASSGTTLNYQDLGGPGLERLCYLLLLADGKVPRYFGRPGQAQYGVDILDPAGGQYALYQCKNVASLKGGDLRALVERFQKEWLGRSHLPAPKQFVLCCPLDLRELKRGIEWLALARILRDSSGTELLCWDRTYLDERLKRLPDIVAELFSDVIAEDFCDLPNWNDGLFRPLREGSGDPAIARFLKQTADGHIYVQAALTEGFAECIARSNCILLLGPPGSGKTTSALALSAEFDYGRHRVFYLDLRFDCTESDVLLGITRRLTRSTIFVLDNCQRDFDLVQRVRERFTLTNAGRGALVLIARTLHTPATVLRDDVDLIESLRQEQAVVEFAPQLADYRKIAVRRAPDFENLSESQVQRLYDLTGGDLALLNQILENIHQSVEIEDLHIETLYRAVLKRHFGKGFLPAFQRLATLAQFDIAPLAEIFPLEKLKDESEKAVAELVMTAGRPPRHFFLHSSAAELIARAIAWRHVADDDNQEIRTIVDYIAHLTPGQKHSIDDFKSFLRSRLRLTSRANEWSLKKSVMADERVLAFFSQCVSQMPLDLWPICLSLDKGGFDQGRYWKLLQLHLTDGTLLSQLLERPPHECRTLLNFFGRNSLALELLRAQTKERGLGDIIHTTILQNLFFLLASLAVRDDAWWETAFDLISDHSLDQLVLRTASAGWRLDTIGFASLNIKRASSSLYEVLHRRMGSSRYLQIIAFAGTIVDLLRLLSNLPPIVALELAAQLASEEVNQLTAVTISSRRSIGTFHMSLRHLKGSAPEVLHAFEERIGAKRYLRIAAQLGTIVDLYKIIDSSSPELAEELVTLLDDQILDAVIDTTLSAGRPIGTLHFTLMQLKKQSEKLLRTLELRVGPHRYLKLIQAQTITDFLRLLAYSSSHIAEQLVELADNHSFDELVRKTLSAKRSIVWVPFLCRELRRQNPTLFVKLESKFGAYRFRRLIAGARSIFELFAFFHYLSLDLLQELISLIEPSLVDQLVEKTIECKQSVGALAFSLRRMRKESPDLHTKFEHLVGIERLWLLTKTNGSFQSLSTLSRQMTQAGRQKFHQQLETLTEEELQELVLRSSFTGLARFARWYSAKRQLSLSRGQHAVLMLALTAVVERESWEGLNQGSETLGGAGSSQFKAALVAAVRARVKAVDLNNLKLRSFRESAACAALLWREADSRDSALSVQLLRLLPDHDTWLGEEQFLHFVRFPLLLSACSEAPAEYARRLLAFVNRAEIADFCRGAKPIDLTVFLWSVYSAWYAWREDKTITKFADFIAPEIVAAAQQALTMASGSRPGQVERDAWISLMGLLNYLGVPQLQITRRGWIRDLPGFQQMVTESLEKRFLAASFFLMGLEWVFGERMRVPQFTWQKLLIRAIEDQVDSPALEALRKYARLRSRR